jgi:ribA/ribD-fused uncharacterized protein
MPNTTTNLHPSGTSTMCENTYKTADMDSNTNDNDYLFFDAFDHEQGSDNAFLSLSYLAPINDGLMMHRSVLHMLSMRKSQFTDDDKTFDSIYYEDTDTKQMAHYLMTPDEDLERGGTKWESYKAYLIVKGLRMKFEQNDDLMDKLVKTVGKTLVNTNVPSGEMGILFTEEDAMENQEAWGMNRLGRVMMTLRDHYAETIQVTDG